VQSVELDALPIFQDLWPTDQRDVVIVNDVKALFQNLPDAGRLEERETRLLGGQRREKAKPAFEPVHGHVGVIVIGSRRLLACQQAVRINTVDHIHPMPAPRQLVGQPVHEDAIPTEVIGWIEGRDHAKAERVICHPVLR
jgi:hypothetical protein